MVLLALGNAVSLPLDTLFQMGNFLVFGRDIKIIRSVHNRHASTTAHEYTCFKKRLVASSKSIIREKVNVIFVTIVNKAFSVWPYYFNNQHPSKPK